MAKTDDVPRGMSRADWNQMLADADLNWQEYVRRWPSAKSVRYDCDTKRLVVELTNGLRLEVPAANLQGVASGTEQERADVHTIGCGTCLEWRTLDQHFTIEGLLTGCFGNPAWMAALTRKKSRAKPSAKPSVRPQNVRKGKRPQKSATAGLS